MAQRHRVRSSLSRPLLTSAVLAAFASPAFAHGDAAGAPQTLDKVVVTASGFEQKVIDAPASISLVNRDEASYLKLKVRPLTSPTANRSPATGATSTGVVASEYCKDRSLLPAES